MNTTRAISAVPGRKEQVIPPWVLWGTGLAGLASMFTPQPWIGLACWLTIPVITWLTRRNEEPPILLYGIVYLWTNAGAQVIYYGVTGESLLQIFGGPELREAIWLTLIGTAVLAAGIGLALYNLPSVPWKRLREEAQALSPERLFMGYLLCYVVKSVLNVRLLPGGISKFIGAVLLLRWATFFLLTTSVLVRRRGYGFLAAALCIEILVGLIGFWGSFKDFFPVFVVAYFGARSISSIKEVSVVSSVFAVVLVLGVFWTAIKPEYRAFLTQGEGAQTVRVPVSAQVDKLLALAKDMDAEQLQNAIEPTVKRVGYVDYFAMTLDYIPRHRPFDKGDGWERGVMHVLRPRLFFPSKPAVHDSEITEEYTGALVSRGTSVSIGYFGESYADFGRFWMFVPIFLVGVGYGLMYRFFVTTGSAKIMGFALAAAFLPTQVGALPSIPRLLGTGLTNFVMLAVLLWFAGPKLHEWACRPDAT